MEQKNEINNLQELLDWIEEEKSCCIEEKGEDYFVIEAPNNATWQIRFEREDKIEDIIYKAIEQLEEFDADEKFTDYWNEEFAKHNGFTPLQFITMLKEDEETFRSLAYKLKKCYEAY
jgi:hypothetical protein